MPSLKTPVPFAPKPVRTTATLFAIAVTFGFADTPKPKTETPASPPSGTEQAISEGKVSIEQATDGKTVRVIIAGNHFCTYHLEGFTSPIIYPIYNPSGTGMTRDWPVIETGREGEERDHPHHKSVFIGHQGINGTDFWHGKGRVVHQRIIQSENGERLGTLQTENLWKDAQGETVLSEIRTLTFGSRNGARLIDIELDLRATAGDVTFEEFKDGFVGIRTHPHLRLKPNPKKGVPEVFGHAINSEGVAGKAIWGQRANWVHYWGTVEQKDAGFAFFAAPNNPRSPTWWHARDYGLISANPFGPTKNGADGELVIKAGASLKLRYRMLFHSSSQEAAAIGEQYQAFANE